MSVKPVYEIQKASSGGMTLTAKHNGTEVRIHSAYDPDREAAKTAAAFDKKKSSLILVSGIGLGYHIRHLREKYPDAQILAIDPDRSLASKAGELYPAHFRDVIVSCGAEDLDSIIEHIDIASFHGIANFVHNPSYRLDPDFYDGYFSVLSRLITSKFSDLLTRFEFEERWAMNIIKNTPQILDSIPVKNFFGQFAGFPGVIISAGPSLGKNMALLESIKDRAVLVAVDTAIKVLDRKKIEPHFVLTLDAQKHSLKHFLGLQNIRPALIADAVSCPEIMRDYRGIKITSTTAKYYDSLDGKKMREATPVMDWFERHSGSIGDIQSGGSVATSAFDLLLAMGCTEIILIGQDLAYTGREIHSSGTHHNDSWLALTGRMLNLDTINQRVIRKRKIKHVEAWGGEGTEVSDFVFDLYKNWIEDSASKVPVPVTNATEGGARIKNCKEESLLSVSGRIKAQPGSPSEIIRRVTASPVKPDRKKTIAAFKGIEAEARRFISLAETLPPGELTGSLAQTGLFEVMRPFLKKTETILTRKNTEPAEGTAMLAKDAVSAAGRLADAVSRIIR